jgi:hypothetical protein
VAAEGPEPAATAAEVSFPDSEEPEDPEPDANPVPDPTEFWEFSDKFQSKRNFFLIYCNLIAAQQTSVFKLDFKFSQQNKKQVFLKVSPFILFPIRNLILFLILNFKSKSFSQTLYLSNFQNLKSKCFVPPLHLFF